MATVQRAALWFGAVNLVLGLCGFFGPFVAGNREGLINIDTGQLFGVMAINWAHALVLVAMGWYGIAARRMAPAARGYFEAVAVVFGLLALLGFAEQAGWWVRRGAEGTLEVLSVATDTAGNLLHLLWFAVGLWFARRPANAVAEPAPRAA